MNWNAVATSNTFCAETKFFKYTIKPIPGTPPLKYRWQVQVCGGKAIKAGGPLSLKAAKAKAQLDFASRIAQGERIIRSGKYQK